MSIGREIRRLRELRRMTQGDLAKTLGVSMQTVSSWELDNSVPRMGALKKLAEYFDVNVSNIVAGVDKNEGTVMYLYSTLTPYEQEQALNYMRYLYQQRQKDRK